MTVDVSKATPAMQRYLELKAQYPDTLLLCRIGDFYELFYQDAETASRVLGITLTSRDKGSANPIPMAGFPYHQLDNYLARIVSAGHRAAICEQLEDASQAKGLVRRDVTRVVTPGTLTDESLLDPRESNYLAAVSLEKDRAGLAWLELSTGRFRALECPTHQLADELSRLAPAELLVNEAWSLATRDSLLPVGARMLLTRRPPWSFAANHTRRVLTEHFGVSSLEGFGWDDPASEGITAAGVLLEYAFETQKSALAHLESLEPYVRGTSLIIDDATRRSLELTRTIREGKREGSLLGVLDETVTPMGARLLAEWLSNPLTHVPSIERRLDGVEEFVGDGALLRDLREHLKQAYDLARLTARVSTGRCSPRDLKCLGTTLALLPRLKARLIGRKAALLAELEAGLDLCPDVRALVEAALVDEPPATLQDGGMIRPGFDPRLDELRDLARGGKEWIAAYQAREAERTGLPGLKVGFNKVFGYYLELTAAQVAKIELPPDWIRKQTLKNQERFVTPDLKQYEEKVLRAEQQAVGLEQELFQQLRDQVAARAARLRTTADILAQLDVLMGLANLAVVQRYVRPVVVTDPVLDIRDGRHPVLDRVQPTGQFVPNDTLLGGDHGRVQLITGPNMAGKSTYIRQTALLAILAQMGSFVPAGRALIGVADRVFARVGASDELSRGQSTFMVEMTETARILHSATDRSLVILDEIGRGTSTYDGISLAWAVTEFLHDALGCRTLFATHYHELTEATKTLKSARNWNVAVRESGEGVVFLHRIVEGAADKSYGIHVARLAGIPMTVVERARVILDTLENDHVEPDGQTKIPARRMQRQRRRQLQLFEPEPLPHPVVEQLQGLDLERLTPLDALATLQRLRGEAGEKR
jgi:DNA mismatch repair protein MutS